MTRVVHVTDSYLPTLGGIELHVRDLVLHQRRHGDDARVLTSSPGGDADADWVHRRTRLSELDPDVVHIHVSVWSPWATRILRTCAHRNVPTVVTVHSLWAPYGRLPAWASVLLGARRWPVVWTAVSTRAATDVGRTLALDGPVHVLPNAVEADEWRPMPPRATSPDELRLVTVGRLAWTKRCLALPSIVHDLRQRLGDSHPVRLEIIGEGPQRASLERRLDRRGLASHVELTGRLDRSEIRRRLRDADVYVAPAELESFGIAALEARCVGLPVVAHARSGVAEFIADGIEGLLVDTDAGFVAALERLAVDPGLREAITRHNRSVPTRHDWDAAMAGTDRVYRLADAMAATSRTRTAATTLAARFGG